MSLLSALVLQAAFLGAFSLPAETGGAVVQQQELPEIAVGQVADLQDQLNAVLRARRPEEFRFIANVVEMTKQGTLPLELVLSTFHYVRTVKKGEKFPFVIFERVLRQRAAERGIGLPPVQ